MPLVYFIDDQVEVLEVFSDFLSQDFKVEIFQDPEELLMKIVRGEKPRVVISDLHMPQMTGVELTERLHRMNPLIRVILVSGAVDRESSIQACNSGVFAIIEKPINPQNLVDTVNSAMEANFLSEKSEKFRKRAADFVSEASELLEHYKNRAQDAEAMLRGLGLLPQDPTQLNSRLFETSQLQLHVQELRKELTQLNEEVNLGILDYKLADEKSKQAA